MTNPVLVERHRGTFIERSHRGRVAIVDRTGNLVAAMGDVTTPFLPRSSCKIMQAVPMVESGAADANRLTPQLLAFACASHQGSFTHAGLANGWLNEMGLTDADLMCGVQLPGDRTTRMAMWDAGEKHCQLHNNCSGKHAGMLCQALHIGAPTAGYIDIDHPVQATIEQVSAELAGEDTAGWVADGCSAPNFALSLTGLARAMAGFAAAETAFTGVRRDAAIRLRDAMASHPFEIAGEGRACTDLIRAGNGSFVVKTGAEGCFTAILPEQGLGIALKIDDGDTMAANTTMAALLVSLGALSADNPAISKWLTPKEVNRRGMVCGGAAATKMITELTLS
ncbi:MAG: asparaginase [Pikeienuella sp.]